MESRDGAQPVPIQDLRGHPGWGEIVLPVVFSITDITDIQIDKSVEVGVYR